MTSETYVFGVPIATKWQWGEDIRAFVAPLGTGHVEAAVRIAGGDFSVEAWAYPTSSRAYDLGTDIVAYLTLKRMEPDAW